MTPIEFDQFVSRPEPVIVVFTGATCAPCKSLKPKLKAVADKGAVLLQEIPVEASRDLVMSQKLRAVPTVIAFKAGKEVLRFSGDKSEGDLYVSLARAGVLNS